MKKDQKEPSGWAWDMFCPQCSATLVGELGTDEKRYQESQDEYKGTILYCSYCDLYISFDSGKKIDLISYLHHHFNKHSAEYKIRIINGG